MGGQGRRRGSRADTKRAAMDPPALLLSGALTRACSRMSQVLQPRLPGGGMAGTQEGVQGGAEEEGGGQGGGEGGEEAAAAAAGAVFGERVAFVEGVP